MTSRMGSDRDVASTERHDDASTVDARAFVDEARQARQGYGRFNLGIVGNTGVGKSSLVNAVFGRDRARVGRGLPVTRGVHYYHDDSLGIWDFEGFEIGSAERPVEQLRTNLRTIAERPADEQIGVVWYCVAANADRLTLHDVGMIRELDAAGLPVILVLTKVDWTRNRITGQYRLPDGVARFRDWIERPVDEHGRPIDLPVRSVIPVSTQDKHGKGTGHGLGDLVDETLALSPQLARNAFRIAQRLNLSWKRELARPVVASAAAASAAAAAIPLPLADAVTLAPIQMTMMGRIAVIYDLELTTMVSAQGIAQLAAQLSGRALAHSLVKVIPVAGGAINATVASAITAATGEGWMRLCEQVHTGKIAVPRVMDAWADFAPTIIAVLNNMAKRTVSRR